MINLKDCRVFCKNKEIGVVVSLKFDGICKLLLNVKDIPSVLEIDGKKFKAINEGLYNKYNVDCIYNFVFENIRLVELRKEDVLNEDDESDVSSNGDNDLKMKLYQYNYFLTNIHNILIKAGIPDCEDCLNINVNNYEKSLITNENIISLDKRVRKLIDKYELICKECV